MFQLTLDFFGLKPRAAKRPRPKPARHDHRLAWKHGLTVHVLYRPRARRYLLRLQPDGSARLVIPHRGTEAEAVKFLERSEAWLLKRLAHWQTQSNAHRPWLDGTTVHFRGAEVSLRVIAAGDTVRVCFATEQIETKPQACYRQSVLAHLRGLAEAELPPRTFELARVHGVTVSRVSVRAQKSRWGSCSARGAISLNWRLIQAPPYVVDYLIIHELMHRREMNHSARYWKHVAEACPAYREAERWLRAHRIETES